MDNYKIPKHWFDVTNFCKQHLLDYGEFISYFVPYYSLFLFCFSSVFYHARRKNSEIFRGHKVTLMGFGLFNIAILATKSVLKHQSKPFITLAGGPPLRTPPSIVPPMQEKIKQNKTKTKKQIVLLKLIYIEGKHRLFRGRLTVESI